MTDWTFAYHLGLFTGFVLGAPGSLVLYYVVKFWTEYLRREDENEEG